MPPVRTSKKQQQDTLKASEMGKKRSKKARDDTSAAVSAMVAKKPSDNDKTESDGANGDSKDEILFFFGASKPNGFLSQFYTFPEPIYDPVTKVHFTSCEQFMMYHKAITFNDNEHAAQILATNKPLLCKRLGRKVIGYDDRVWGKVRYDTVVRGNMLKFGGRQNVMDEDVAQGSGTVKGKDTAGNSGRQKSLRNLLLATGERGLVEAAPRDRIWGIGFGAASAEKVGRNKWGQNLLGKALMEVRAKLREEMQAQSQV